MKRFRGNIPKFHVSIVVKKSIFTHSKGLEFAKYADIWRFDNVENSCGTVTCYQTEKLTRRLLIAVRNGANQKELDQACLALEFHLGIR